MPCSAEKKAATYHSVCGKVATAPSKVFAMKEQSLNQKVFRKK
jgi:hypothetical protein